jgi:hypothetical protein
MGIVVVVELAFVPVPILVASSTIVIPVAVLVRLVAPISFLRIVAVIVVVDVSILTL